MHFRLSFLFVIILNAFNLQCSSDQQEKKNTTQIQGMRVSFPDTTQTHHLDGPALAAVYCQACHSFPDPALLSKAIWQKRVLPNMAMRMGISPNLMEPYVNLSAKEIKHIVSNNVYAHHPLISKTDWQKIVEYYITKAPDSDLAQDAKVSPINELPGFTEWLPAMISTPAPLTTLVKYDTSSKTLFVGDRRKNLFQFNEKLQVVDSIKLSSPPSDVLIEKQQIWTLTMGFMDPSDEYNGELLNRNFSTKKANTIISGLPRPVHMSLADINADNTKDWIISGYGNQTGRLSWFETGKDSTPVEHVLKPVPGTLKTLVYDFNQDGKSDVMALMAQGNEQISIFYNLGNGHFKEESVLRFPPVQGSSYFELADFNKDGSPDILYTNGDNADYSFALKKYHGVRIFLNDGKNNFQEKWFYPMYGASKAITRDFDGDGDLDIAAISFFPDIETKARENFIYFENGDHLLFQPHTTEVSQRGRWLVMDAGDVDQDGDEDIILGSFTFSPTPTPEKYSKSWQNTPPFIILRNTTR